MLAPLSPDMAQRLLSPSARVLVGAARPGTIDVETLPWSDVHWPTLVSLMAYERAEVPVARLLRRLGDRVPADVRSVAQGLERVARFRAAELGDAATGVIDALERANVPALWLKGAALAMQSGEGFAVRSMGDLDLLIAPADLTRARAALTAAGWSMPRAEGYAGHHHDAPMVRPGGLRLELHTQLFPNPHPFADDATPVWLSRAREVVWGRRRVLVLPAAWHVVHASVHWVWSHEGRVGTWQYLHDMHRLTAVWPDQGAEWEAVVWNAEQLGAELAVGWGIWTARELSGLPVRELVVNRLRGRLRVLDGLVERQWVLAAFHSPAASPSVRWSRFWWQRAMQGLGRGGDRMPWAAGRAGALVEPVPEETPSRRGSDLARWRRHLARILRS